MRRPSRVSRLVTYGLLLAGSALFGFPLLWMTLTALKPIEQTMAQPPVWLPTVERAALDGKETEVTRVQEVTVPSYLIERYEGGRRELVTGEAAPPEEGARRVIRKAETGWWLVEERSATKVISAVPKRDVVPPDAITTAVKFRWDNFRVALASMGGRSVEAVEGTVAERPPNPETDAGFLTFLANTLIVCVLGVVGTVLSNALIAYGFARIRWRGRDVFFAITLATMMVPFPVLMVPLYGIFKELGWIGTLLPLWVPYWFGSAFNIFLMRQFFLTIPEELSEAARIDGASEWKIFWRVILPLSRPVLAVAALFHFLHAWNDFLGPLLYITRKSGFTLALALQNFQSQQGGVQWHHLMAASLVTVLPVIVVFFLAQKTFIQGIATTGSKG